MITLITDVYTAYTEYTVSHIKNTVLFCIPSNGEALSCAQRKGSTWERVFDRKWGVVQGYNQIHGNLLRTQAMGSVTGHGQCHRHFYTRYATQGRSTGLPPPPLKWFFREKLSLLKGPYRCRYLYTQKTAPSLTYFFVKYPRVYVSAFVEGDVIIPPPSIHSQILCERGHV